MVCACRHLALVGARVVLELKSLQRGAQQIRVLGSRCLVSSGPVPTPVEGRASLVCGQWCRGLVCAILRAVG